MRLENLQTADAVTSRAAGQILPTRQMSMNSTDGGNSYYAELEITISARSQATTTLEFVQGGSTIASQYLMSPEPVPTSTPAIGVDAGEQVVTVRIYSYGHSNPTGSCNDDPSYKTASGEEQCPIWKNRVEEKIDTYEKHCAPGKTPATRCCAMCKQLNTTLPHHYPTVSLCGEQATVQAISNQAGVAYIELLTPKVTCLGEMVVTVNQTALPEGAQAFTFPYEVIPEMQIVKAYPVKGPQTGSTRMTLRIAGFPGNEVGKADIMLESSDGPRIPIKEILSASASELSVAVLTPATSFTGKVTFTIRSALHPWYGTADVDFDYANPEPEFAYMSSVAGSFTGGDIIEILVTNLLPTETASDIGVTFGQRSGEVKSIRYSDSDATSLEVKVPAAD